MKLKRVIVSAPFGNWIEHPLATSTLGTYTVENRAGWRRWWMLWRILWTLRPIPRLGAWVNKLGLPSPGIKSLVDAHGQDLKSGSLRWHIEMMNDPMKTPRAPWNGLEDRIVSIHGFDEDEWNVLLGFMTELRPGWIEMNVSCPNVGELSVPKDLFTRAVATGVPVIVKLPPVRYWETFIAAHDAGVRIFHLTNTLPVPCGGLSGKPLKAVALDVVKRVKDAKRDVTVIGGGGITGPEDVVDYAKAGADHFAVASAFLSLWRKKSRSDLISTIAGAAAGVSSST